MPRRNRLPLILLSAGAAVSALTMLQGIQPNDEGLMLQAAARIADGQVPYEDFWWFYPPGQPYLLAGLWEVFGPSLVVWRVVRVAANAVIALLVHVLARRHAGPRLALAGWAAATLALAFPSGPHPFPIAVALALGAILAIERPALAGALAGACAAWRIEFAAYLGLGIVLAYAAARRDALARSARFAAGAAASALVLFGPVVAAAGVGDSWDLLVRYPVEDFGEYQSLPFPFDYDGPLNTSSVGGFLSDSAENILHFYLPLALMLAFGGALAVLALAHRPERWRHVAVAVFAVGMAHYLLARTDLFHTAPLAVMVAILGPWAIEDVRRGEPWRWLEARGAAALRAGRSVALAGAALVALGGTWMLADGLDQNVRALTDDTSRLRLDVADGVRARRAADIRAAVRLVRARVPEGEPIYVATRRADLVTTGNPLLYVLADRPNPTRYDIQAPGVVTSAPVQREIVRDLERARPEIVVRDTSPVTAQPEPNRAGESSGVRILDDYLARRYRGLAVFGDLVVLERRPARPPE